MAGFWSRGAGRTFKSLQHRNYRLLWLGQTGHSASLWMDQVARAVLIVQLTDSALILSLVIATRLVPILLFGLIAGALADRSDKRKILLVTQCVSAASHLALAVLVIGGWIEAWHVFVTAAVAGTAMAFNQPVRQSLISATVPPADLMNAIALNSSAVSFMRIGGGSLAGLLLIPFDVGGVYLVNVGIYVFVIATTLMMSLPARPASAKERGSIFGDLREGFAYVAGNPNLGIVTALAVILFVFGFPYQQVFVPLLALKTLDMGNSGVGFLAGATGVGAFAGSLVVAWKSGIKRPGLQLMINMVIFGGALVLVSLQTNIVLTALFLAVAGSMTVTYMAFTNGILLANSDPDMHGRVMSLLSLDRGLIPLGSILAGTLASSLGIRPGLFLMGATIVILSGLVLIFAGRRLATIEGDAVRGHGRRVRPTTVEPGAPGDGEAGAPTPTPEPRTA